MNPLNPFDSNIGLLNKVLDLRAQKAQVISSNIANAETPGFSPSRFEFEEDLKHAISQKEQTSLTSSHPNHITTAPAHFNSVVGKIRMEEDKAGIGDANGVSVADEMLDLTENALLYETTVQLLNKKMSLLKHVVQGGQ